MITKRSARLALLLVAGPLIAGCYDREENSAADNSLTQSSGDLAYTPRQSSNGPPTISGKPPAYAIAESSYEFLPSASDPDSDQMGFSVNNLPKWARFNSATGGISGKPTADDVGVSRIIKISVSDGQTGSELAPFQIVVLIAGEPTPDPNSPPTITGTPGALATVNSPYLFQPDVFDIGNEPLQFAIANLPHWLSYDENSGRLSGTPGEGDIGIYSNIFLSVSDGLSIDTLGPLAIEVLAIGTHSTTLSWAPPMENEDGSSVRGLAGYKIRYGQLPDDYPNLIDIPNPGVTAYVVDGLLPGSYYFVSTAYTYEGRESEFSDVLTVNLY